MWRGVVLGGVMVCALAAPHVAVASPPNERQLEKARSLLGSSSAKVRIKAADILARANQPGTVHLLVPLLQDSDALVRAAVCDLLAQTQDVAALPFLQEAAKDPDALVQKRAAAALTALRETASRSAVQVTAVHTPQGMPPQLGGAVRSAVLASFGAARRQASAEPGGRWVMQVTVHAPVVRTSKAETVVQVGASATLMELPGRQLRFSARVDAAAAVDGAASQSMRAELTQDAALEAARNLTADVEKWLSGPAH
jgi:hypothetical protein